MEEVVSENIISEIFRMIAMVFALILGNVSGTADTETLAPATFDSTLSVEFVAKGEQFSPAAPVQLQNSFDARGLPAIMIFLPPGDAKRFGDFTKRHLGQKMEMRACGTVLATPVVQEAIYGGSIMLSGDKALEAMEEYMANGCP